MQYHEGKYEFGYSRNMCFLFLMYFSVHYGMCLDFNYSEIGKPENLTKVFKFNTL